MDGRIANLCDKILVPTRLLCIRLIKYSQPPPSTASRLAWEHCGWHSLVICLALDVCYLAAEINPARGTLDLYRCSNDPGQPHRNEFITHSTTTICTISIGVHIMSILWSYTGDSFCCQGSASRYTFVILLSTRLFVITCYWISA